MTKATLVDRERERDGRRRNVEDLRKLALRKVGHAVVHVSDVLHGSGDLVVDYHAMLRRAVRAMCEAREALECLRGAVDELESAAAMAGTINVPPRPADMDPAEVRDALRGVLAKGQPS